MNNKEYCELYLRYLELIQKHGRKTKPVHLLFAPIGTNIVFLANQLHINIKHGLKTLITPGYYKYDEKNLADFNHKYQTSHCLEPWVLQRYDQYFEHQRSWEIWFQDINSNSLASVDYPAEKKRLELALKKYKNTSDNKLLQYAVCLNYVSRFNAESMAFLKQYDYVGNQDCVAVHIRRGDACTEDLKIADENRQHHHLDEYKKNIESFITKGNKYFYVMTESQQEIDVLRQQLGKRVQVFCHHMDRSKFISIKNSHYDPLNFVEYRCLTDPEFAKISMESALIDIYNCQKCTAFIGTFSSQFSVLNYLKMLGYNKAFLATANLSGSQVDQYFPKEKRLSYIKNSLIALGLYPLRVPEAGC